MAMNVSRPIRHFHHSRHFVTPASIPANMPLGMALGKFFGPGTLVAAAFIGPGTVTVCTLAGAEHGYSLLWALAFSVLATVVLQEMAARIGWATQDGLGSALRRAFTGGWRRVVFFALVLAAVVVGNAAYQAGNIGGAVLGVEAVVAPSAWWSLVLGAVAFALLFIGRYRILQGILLALVLFMSVSFLATAVMLRPDLGAIAAGLLPRRIDSASLLTVVGLIGTTVVPYNLFLHAASVREKWGPDSELGDVRRETAFAILVGGLISLAIVIVAAAAFWQTGVRIESAADMATQLEPLLGRWARTLMGLGLFAAGISSAVTAPLAAALAARELFAWSRDLRDLRFRLVWMGVLAAGVVFASLGITPVVLIRFAQAANGVLLPVIAVFLLTVVNRTSVMGEHPNRGWQNLIGLLIVGVTALLAGRAMIQVFRL